MIYTPNFWNSLASYSLFAVFNKITALLQQYEVQAGYGLL